MKISIKSFFLLFVLIFQYPLTHGQENDRNLRLREFVIMGYQGIRLDLTSGSGPYLQTLLDLLGRTARDTKVREELKSLVSAYPNIMDFADQVASLQALEPRGDQSNGVVTVPSGPGVVSGDLLDNALAHLTRGMPITVTLKTGEQLQGTFSEYSVKRLWIRGSTRRSVTLDEILAIKTGQP